jgi:hypothetical protein
MSAPAPDPALAARELVEMLSNFARNEQAVRNVLHGISICIALRDAAGDQDTVIALLECKLVLTRAIATVRNP